jgi:hypothetical protein
MRPRETTMIVRYERCEECGNKYDIDYIQQVLDRRVCSLCRWMQAAGAGRLAGRIPGVRGGPGRGCPELDDGQHLGADQRRESRG